MAAIFLSSLQICLKQVSEHDNLERNSKHSNDKRSSEEGRTSTLLSFGGHLIKVHVAEHSNSVKQVDFNFPVWTVW